MDVSSSHMHWNGRRNNTRRKCRYYKQGRCKFGSHCMYSHENNRGHAGSSSSTARVDTNRGPASSSSSTARVDTNRVPASSTSLTALVNTNIAACSTSSTARVDTSSTKSTSDEAAAASSSAADQQIVDNERCCGICFDAVLSQSKKKKDQVFGILPNCKHCFCFPCIRRWRQSRQFSLNVTKSCPECRISSDFVYTSKIWVNTKEEKDKLISDRRASMAQRNCRYFMKGARVCPFGNECFYRHSLPNGEIIDVGPKPPPKFPQIHHATVTTLPSVNELLYYLVNEDYFDFDDDDDDEEDDDGDDYESDFEVEAVGLSDYDMFPFYSSDEDEFFPFQNLFGVYT